MMTVVIFSRLYQNKNLSLAYIKNNNVIEEEEDFKNYRIELNHFIPRQLKAHLVTTY